MVFPRTDENIQAVREASFVLREEVIIFSWCSRALSLIERNLSFQERSGVCQQRVLAEKGK